MLAPHRQYPCAAAFLFCAFQVVLTGSHPATTAEVMGQAFKELQQEKGWKREEIVFSTKVGASAKMTLHTTEVIVSAADCMVPLPMSATMLVPCRGQCTARSVIS